MKEYRVQAFHRKPNTNIMDWFGAAYPLAQCCVRNFKTLGEAEIAMSSLIETWKKFLAGDITNHRATEYARKYAPTQFRIVTREITEWEPVKGKEE